jgi:hypothetical protein
MQWVARRLRIVRIDFKALANADGVTITALPGATAPASKSLVVEKLSVGDASRKPSAVSKWSGQISEPSEYVQVPVDSRTGARVPLESLPSFGLGNVDLNIVTMQREMRMADIQAMRKKDPDRAVVVFSAATPTPAPDAIVSASYSTLEGTFSVYDIAGNGRRGNHMFRIRENPDDPTYHVIYEIEPNRIAAMVDDREQRIKVVEAALAFEAQLNKERTEYESQNRK